MSDPKERLFRKEALGRLSSPERLDQLMQVVGPRDWLSLLALTLLVAAGLTWAVWGRLSTSITGRGVLIRTSGITELHSPASGRLIAINVRTGDSVRKGDVLGMVALSERNDPVICEHTGRVIEVTSRVGQMIDRGDRLGALEIESQPIRLVGLVYFPLGDGSKIKPQMQILLTPDDVSQKQYGGIRGTVSSVSAFPVTKERVTALTGNAGEALERLLADGAQIEVIADLEPDPSTFSGYQWSSPTGPQLKFPPGTLITASVTVEERAPITYILPFSKTE